MKKRYWILILLILVIATGLFFLSTLTKNWLVKNSEELTGRKLAIAELHFNYWEVAVRARQVTLYEANQVDSFISFSELYINFAPWKLLGKEYSFSEISLDRPRVNLEKNGDLFNFSDMLPESDSSLVAEAEPKNNELKFSIYNLNMTNGEVHFSDLQMGNHIELNKLNFNLPLIAWNNQQSNVGAEFNIGELGKVVLNATVDNAENTYDITVQTTEVPLHPATGYLKEYMDVDTLKGLLNSDLQIAGSMDDIMDIRISGQAKINNLAIVDGASQEILSAPETRISLKDINLKNFHFGFSSIELDQPSLYVERNPEMTNLERFFLPLFQTDTIQVVEISMVDNSGPETTYAIDSLKIQNGRVLFADKTLNREGITRISNLDVKVSELSENSTAIPVTFSANLNNGGDIQGTAVLNMVDPMNFEFEGHLKRLDLVSFSPYSEFYIASPFTQGWFNYNLQIKIADQYLTNQNKIKVEELEFGKRTADKPFVKVPIRLALYILKDAKDNITIDMPVSGSTADPQFKVGKLIWKTFINLIEKTALSPFNALAGLAGTNPEKMELVRFEYTQDSLMQEQYATLDALARILSKKPELVLIMTQRTDATAEMDHLSMKLAKTDFMQLRRITELPENTDTAFLSFVREKVAELDSIGLEKALPELIPASRIQAEFRELLEKRNQLIRDYFTSKGLPETSVQVSTADLRNLPEEIKRPEFKVEVSLQ
ncbi:AsmA family protein [Gaoshiqia sediminis]|uniref:DUF748 domain-containing protein n=1 Tax=Gaoshiqia sediminis TaxID=2986998 RepID=A0AA42C4L6_9BACT|nr:DUF748 domain-containing protein [Gaoshiqia sediminis]MCW0481908.1 DUF748 domain-containing protein [Gaoshiqia sediminis]